MSTLFKMNFKVLYVVLTIVFIVVVLIKNNSEDNSDISPSIEEEIEAHSLQAPVYETVTIQDKPYDVLDFGSILWMADDLNVDVGTSVLVKRVYYADEVTEKKEYNVSPRRYYDFKSAITACRNIGWRLPTFFDFIEMAEFIAPSSDSTLYYDAMRAYGLLLDKGESKFNANLFGYYDPNEDYRIWSDEYNKDWIFPYEGKHDVSRVHLNEKQGYYWLLDDDKTLYSYKKEQFEQNYDPINFTPIILNFSRVDGVVVTQLYNNTTDYPYYIPCRCVKNK